MNKALLAAAAAIAIAAIIALAPSADTRAAEADDDQNVVGVMRVDMAPVLAHVQALQAEVTAVKQAVEALQKTIDESTQHQADMLAAVRSLTPKAWDYKLLRIINERESQLLGQQGWEMVAITPQGWVFFRRPLVEGEAPRALR